MRAGPGTTEMVSATFLLDQRTMSQVNTQTNQVLQYALWGIPGEYEALLPKLVSLLSVSLSELEEWAMIRICPTLWERQSQRLLMGRL